MDAQTKEKLSPLKQLLVAVVNNTKQCRSGRAEQRAAKSVVEKLLGRSCTEVEVEFVLAG